MNFAEEASGKPTASASTQHLTALLAAGYQWAGDGARCSQPLPLCQGSAAAKFGERGAGAVWSLRMTEESGPKSQWDEHGKGDVNATRQTGLVDALPSDQADGKRGRLLALKRESPLPETTWQLHKQQTHKKQCGVLQ